MVDSSGSGNTQKKRKIDCKEAACYSEKEGQYIRSPVEHTLQQLRWQEMVQRAVLSIVSIRFSQVAAFDTEAPDAAEASGFVVDAKQGIILTNRHVVCSGPFIGEAIFHDHEEVAVVPIYRDPVRTFTLNAYLLKKQILTIVCPNTVPILKKIHDFGFLRFDPSKIKHQPVVETKLAPDAAIIGQEIRVVGNDAGEKLSILSGSISRINRNAPNYGDISYNDFNTFYIQAASSTSSGSSGSPVLDIDGNAVALQAGGHTNASTDFFMPLEQVKRALEYIRRGEVPPRATILVQFYYTPFDEIRRLGFPEHREVQIRSMFPDDIGALTVETVIPGSEASKFLEEGDIFISANDKMITKFVPLENILDENIGNSVKLLVNRGGVDIEFELTVLDLEAITPNRYLEAGGAKLNPVSYQLANQFCIPMDGIHIADMTGMFNIESVERGSVIIISFNAKKISTLDDFIEVFKEVSHLEVVPVIYYTVSDVHTSEVLMATADRHWSKFRLCVRNDKTGYWDYTDLGNPPPMKPIKPSLLGHDTSIESSIKNGNYYNAYYKALVRVMMSMPYNIEGFPRTKKLGAGIVLDTNNGFVLVSRSVVPYSFGDITITFNETLCIPAKPIFLHPTHNYAILKYDPSLTDSSLVKQIELCSEEFVQGESTCLIGMRCNMRPVFVSTNVTDISPIKIPCSPTPKYRAINFNGISVDSPIAQQCMTGFLLNSQNKAKGVWLTFLGDRKSVKSDVERIFGIESGCIISVIESLRNGKEIKLRGFAAEFAHLQMYQAVNMGLSNERIREIKKLDDDRNFLFMIIRTEYSEDSSPNKLQDIDVILEINGELVTKISSLELSSGFDEEVDVVVLRDKREMKFRTKTKEFKNEDIDRIFLWAGAVIHEPHQAVLMQLKSLPSRVLIVHRSKGSPAYMYGLMPTQFIIAINGTRVNTLGDFIDATRDLVDETYVRVKTVSFDLVPSMISVKLFNHYWPSIEYVRDKNSQFGWVEVKSQFALLPRTGAS